MIVAPIFGYLGDRLKRKYLMAGGVLVWSLVVYSSTLLGPDVSRYLLHQNKLWEKLMYVKLNIRYFSLRLNISKLLLGIQAVLVS
jgi:uncharacterized membrane protein SpoIIM required for sporulation